MTYYKLRSIRLFSKSINKRKGISSDIMNHAFSENISLKIYREREKEECVADCEMGIESKTKLARCINKKKPIKNLKTFELQKKVFLKKKSRKKKLMENVVQFR